MQLIEFLHLLNHVLAVFKLAGLFVQLVPSYNSVAPVLVGALEPPKPKFAVCVPAAAKLTIFLYLKHHQLSNLFHHILL
jgi:hypothetical protein